MRVVNRQNLKTFLPQEDHKLIFQILLTLKTASPKVNVTLGLVNNILNEGHYRYFGVEYIDAKQVGGWPLVYINSGDIYNPTIFYYQGKYRIGDVGSILEKHNNRRGD